MLALMLTLFPLFSLFLQGEIDRSALEAVHRRAASAAPTVRGREVAVYNYTPGLLPRE